jgi:hypothetical protein
MARKTSMGKCESCGEVVAKNAMVRHIEKCVREKEAAAAGGAGAPPAEILHIMAEASGAPMYWLHVDVSASATLKTLDAFLRDIWLECCGHLSEFTIGEDRFVSHPDRAMGDRGMSAAIGKVLEPGMKFFHTYDFGTSTVLVLKVVSAHAGTPPRKGVRLLARNEPPEIPCNVCEKPAVQICAECVWDGKGCLCAACAEKHDCDEDMFLPVVNSPRTGVCGYSG